MKSPFLLLTGLLLAGLPTFAQSTWTKRHEATNGGEMLWSIADGNAGMVAVGTNGRILHSLDGRTWTPRTSGATGWLVKATYGNGRYVVVGENGTILTSTNATTWTSTSLTGTTARLNNVLFAQNKFVAVGESGVIVVSLDGVTWNPAASGISGRWLHGLAFAGGQWITTGQSGAIATSSDGLTWTSRSIGTTDDLEAVVPAPARSTTYTYSSHTLSYTYFLAVGANGASMVGVIASSTYPDSPERNSTTFSGTVYRTAGTTARLRGLAHVNNVFIATGESGTILRSGSIYGPWQRVSVATTQNLVAAAAVQGTLMLVGENETMFQSEQIFTSRLGNIATRGVATSGANSMIAGTIVTGARPKQMLIRGIGPALAALGVPGVLADPVLDVYDANARLVATNRGWGSNLNASAIAAAATSSGAFALPANSRDAAMLLTLSPGSYTFQLSSASGASGNALVEAYDLDAIDATSPRAINISTRGHVGAGDNILIAGLVVQGQSSRTLLVRGVGPTLAQFGVPGTLSDPIVKVIAPDGSVLATNDNWSDITLTNGRPVTAEEVQTAAGASGAFPLAANSRDAALLVTLVPGNYTIQVSGANNATGVALVEAYDVPN